MTPRPHAVDSRCARRFPGPGRDLVLYLVGSVRASVTTTNAAVSAASSRRVRTSKVSDHPPRSCSRSTGGFIMPAHSFTALTPLAFLERASDVFADKTAIAYGEHRMSYSEFGDEATRLARALQASGVERGDRVAYMVPEHPGDAGGQLRRAAGRRGAGGHQHQALGRGGPVRVRPLRRDDARGRHGVPAGSGSRARRACGPSGKSSRSATCSVRSRTSPLTRHSRLMTTS